MSKNHPNRINNGVMLNAYPDSIGNNLGDTIKMLKLPEFRDAFSLFYILPTFFNSDLDRGFSIINYDLNTKLVSESDLEALKKLGIHLKFDIVLNHLSVASPQFKDVLKHGNTSKYKDFFINWNIFWEGHGDMNEDGIIIPKETFLNKLFMRKSGLPILKIPFPDGTEKPYWNTFYQQITYNKIETQDLYRIKGLSQQKAFSITKKINSAIENHQELAKVDFEDCSRFKNEILQIVNQNRTYLGQMDVNGNSPLVWDFYEETLKKLSDFGCKILRLDAFAYLHKEIGQSNFFNTPGTWEYLERIKKIALKNGLTLLPEIHAEYGLHLHDKVADKGYYIYDFFLPGLTIHTIETSNCNALIKWAKEVVSKNYKTINMLGCHDGIPVLDLKGKNVNGFYNNGLLCDKDIERIMSKIMERGGRVKNLYDPSGKKISYYQINATFYSALGENDQKLLLARAIQIFMPGIPQIWYLDLFAGKNDYEAANKSKNAGHKEINRSHLTLQNIENGLKTPVVLNQLKMIKLRNTSKAFSGTLKINETSYYEIDFKWVHKNEFAHLKANLKTHGLTLKYTEAGVTKTLSF